MRRTILVLASVALAVLFFWSITESPPPAAQTTPTKPNIVFNQNTTTAGFQQKAWTFKTTT